MKIKKDLRIYWGTLSAITIGLGANYGYANVLEEVLVTAQKREENLQDVGLSVSALSGDQLQALNLNNTIQVTQQIPGLQVSTYMPGFTIFNLRGISQNNFQDNLEPPIAVYVDDVYTSNMNAVNAQMFDMNSVEVLRGPQGTLYGRNATGGLVHYRTNQADETDLNGYIRASVGEFGNQAIEGAVGGGSERVRLRVAGMYETHDGYIKPGFWAGPDIEASGRNAGGADGYSLRGNLQVDVTSNTLLTLGATYLEDDRVPTGQYVVRFADQNPETSFGQNAGAPITGDVHRHASDANYPGMDRDSTTLSAKLSHAFDNGLSLDYIGAWNDMYKYYIEDAGGGLVYFPFSTQAEYETITHEIRLSAENERLKWQAGAYFLDIDYSGIAVVAGPAIVGDSTGEVHQAAAIDSENWSIFGEVELALSERVTAIAGLRWSQDDKTIRYRNTAENFSEAPLPDGTILFDLADQIAANPSYANVDEVDYGDWAGRFQLNYALESALLYASVNRGIKGGNWSPSSSVSLDDFQHKEEVIWSYETGYKGVFMDGAMRFNAGAFYYDYEDYQAFSLTGATPQITNQDATVYGGEVELVVLPNSNWDISLGLSLLESEVDFIPGVSPGTGAYDTELPQAPAMSFNYLVRYNVDLMGGNVAFQLDGVHNDDQYFEGSNAEVSLQEAYSVANLSVGYSTDTFSLTAWVKNAGDEDYLLYNLDIAYAGFIEQVYAPPRQYGVTAQLNF